MSSAARVGVFMLVILAILGFFVLKIEDINVHRQGRGTRVVTAVFDDVAGLDNKSPVRIAGVRKGKVKDIEVMPNGKARVTMEIDDDVPFHSNATARVTNLGLLGEKYIELNPGTSAAPVVPNTNQETMVQSAPAPASIDDVTTQISSIATDVKAVTASMRDVLGGPSGERRLEEIVGNVQAITAQTRELIAANRANVDAMMANVRVISEQLRTQIPRLADSIDRVATEVGGTVGENRKDVHQVVENLRDLSKDLRTTADNLNNITGQVRSGEGTVGKLLYSNEAHDKLTNALTSVESGVNELRNTLGKAAKMRLDLGIQGNYYAGLKQTPVTQFVGGNSRSEVMLRITPDPEKNRFYNINIADDPHGSAQTRTYQQTITDPATGQTTTTITDTTKYDRTYLLGAQVGWVLNDFAVRIGMIDSTGGAALDYKLNPRISVTGEAFDFGKKRDPNPHLRFSGQYVVRHETPKTPLIFVSGGIDNPLNKNSRAVTFGGGIRWRDDDLKYLLSSVPVGR
ncbi:MAG TPA: MlaD family protein [Thermoanaerobaculia bacterium]|nr:MlaD family protein [Thermoanaerobaculia bacterium]